MYFAIGCMWSISHTLFLQFGASILCWEEYFKQDRAHPPHPPNLHSPLSLSPHSLFGLRTKLKQDHAACTTANSEATITGGRKRERKNKQGDVGKYQCIRQKYLLYHFASAFLLAHPAVLQSPAFYCLPAASINYGWYYVCE